MASSAPSQRDTTGAKTASATPRTTPNARPNHTSIENTRLAFWGYPSPFSLEVRAPPPEPIINPSDPIIMMTGNVRLIAAKPDLPAKLATKNPSTME